MDSPRNGFEHAKRKAQSVMDSPHNARRDTIRARPICMAFCALRSALALLFPGLRTERANRHTGAYA